MRPLRHAKTQNQSTDRRTVCFHAFLHKRFSCFVYVFCIVFATATLCKCNPPSQGPSVAGQGACNFGSVIRFSPLWRPWKRIMPNPISWGNATRMQALTYFLLFPSLPPRVCLLVFACVCLCLFIAPIILCAVALSSVRSVGPHRCADLGIQCPLLYVFASVVSIHFRFRSSIRLCVLLPAVPNVHGPNTVGHYQKHINICLLIKWH